jgi:hypothetical protein
MVNLLRDDEVNVSLSAAKGQQLSCRMFMKNSQAVERLAFSRDSAGLLPKENVNPIQKDDAADNGGREAGDQDGACRDIETWANARLGRFFQTVVNVFHSAIE